MLSTRLTDDYFFSQILIISSDGQELDSPKNVAAPRHHINSPDPNTVATPVPPSRKSRFAALAANINSWEDDLNHPTSFKEEVGHANNVRSVVGQTFEAIWKLLKN